MDENTRFIMELMNRNQESLIKELKSVRRELLAKIDRLESFRNKVIGMATLAGGIAGTIVEVVLKK